MKDFDDYRTDITDALMRGESINGFRLQDILDGDFELAQRLAAVWKRTSSYRQQAYDDLETACRKVVENFVNTHMDEVVRERLDADLADYQEFSRRRFA